MEESRHTYYQDLYSDFFDIPDELYREKVRFFDDFKKDFQCLEDQQFYHVKIEYVTALFEIGTYEHFLKEVDHIIEYVIINNYRYHKGKDIYLNLLRSKACALYNMDNFESAITVGEQLHRMNPKDNIIPYLLKKCYRRQRPKWYQHTLGLIIFLFLCAIVMFFAHVLVVEPIKTEWVQNSIYIRNKILVIAVTTMIFVEILFHLRVEAKLVQNLKKDTKKIKHKSTRVIR